MERLLTLAEFYKVDPRRWLDLAGYDPGSTERGTTHMGEPMTGGVGSSPYVDPNQRSQGLTVDDYETVQQAAQIMEDGMSAFVAAMTVGFGLLKNLREPSALERGDSQDQPE